MVDMPDGRTSGKRLVAKLVAEAVTTGKVTFPGEDTQSTLGMKDWMEFVKWAYQYLDPPIQRSEIAGTGTDGAIRLEVEYVNNPYPTAAVPPGAGGNTPKVKED